MMMNPTFCAHPMPKPVSPLLLILYFHLQVRDSRGKNIEHWMRRGLCFTPQSSFAQDFCKQQGILAKKKNAELLSDFIVPAALKKTISTALLDAAPPNHQPCDTEKLLTSIDIDPQTSTIRHLADANTPLHCLQAPLFLTLNIDEFDDLDIFNYMESDLSASLCKTIQSRFLNFYQTHDREPQHILHLEILISEEEFNLNTLFDVTSKHIDSSLAFKLIPLLDAIHCQSQLMQSCPASPAIHLASPRRI